MGKGREDRERQHHEEQTTLDEDNFKDEILVGPYSRGWGGVVAGADVSGTRESLESQPSPINFQGRSYLLEGGHSVM